SSSSPCIYNVRRARFLFQKTNISIIAVKCACFQGKMTAWPTLNIFNPRGISAHACGKHDGVIAAVAATRK
ncbi:MAG: hypothetical protein KGQ70_09905, partial [Alphaproteobacteria bacterium]|nr:hypothetical protein [Alphaproteobacteria bacterium]